MIRFFLREALAESRRMLAGGLWVSCLLLPPALSLAQTNPDLAGRELYRRECARCHGRAGQGVKGKYDDALHGDWSLEKLIRYIGKSMPDDEPGKLSASDTEAVARYINDAFYSREARARNHPARVELVRLTNRQYLNTVADLLNGFLEGAGQKTEESQPGLLGTYYNGRGFRNKIAERTDRQIQFDFGTNAPFPDKTGTNGFSIQWTGSIQVERTGDYEFSVLTPNGTRLWVNDEQKPLIDGSVSSGDFSQHKASVRLLGSRRYPLRLELFKAPKDPKASVVLQWKPPRGSAESIPARSLRPQHIASTFVVTTPFPPDDSSVGYERGTSVSKAWDEATTQAAVEVAGYVLSHLDALSRSKAGATNRMARLQAFGEEFVAAAFRRPLTPAQQRTYITQHFKRPLKPEESLRRIILLALKSPRFLYLGLDGMQRDDFEVASRLSFGLWDSMPDTALFQAARANHLQTAEEVSRQARRMLADGRARAKVRHFLHQWLQVEHVEDLAKDTSLYPGFTPEIISDLRTSLDLFLDDVVWSPASDYRRLLLEDDLYVNQRLADFYGISTNTAEQFVKVSLDPKQRSGVITHPYLLAAFSYQKSSSPIHRGVFLTRNIVGRALKPPPMAVAFKEADFDPTMTMREKVAELTRPQACQTCHSVINPLGFSLEHYDAVGRFRIRDGQRLIDASGDYTTDDGLVVKLNGARDVAEFAVGSEHAQEAFVEQLFHQLVKQPVLAYGPERLEQFRRAFVQSGFNMQQLIVDIVTVAALHHEGRPMARKRS